VRRSREGFDHERFDAYTVALAFATLTREITQALPKGRHSIGDQLEGAAASIVLNLAEGAGEFSRREKARFYRIALRSATEAAAALDVGHALGYVTRDHQDNGKEKLNRIAAMLQALVHRTRGVEPALDPSATTDNLDGT